MATVSEFFKGKGVILTGGTGFLGKALTEKLLRECPEVGKVYLLVRPAKDKTPAARVKAILEEEFFDILRADFPNFEDKVEAVGADLSKPNMDIRDERQLEEIRNNVSVILNCAATVNFNERLDISLSTNVSSVEQLLLLARSLRSLVAFVHVSTAYSQCDKLHIEEKFYPPPVDPSALINLVNSSPAEVFVPMTKPLIGQRPNTYTFTKSLAESMAKEKGSDLPLAIVRPSIVGCTARSPRPGWTDNLNGPGGLYLSYAHKILKYCPGNEKATLDIVPVDHCVNMIMAVAWKLGRNPPKEPAVYNCVSSSSNPLLFGIHNRHLSKAINAAPVLENQGPVSLTVVSYDHYLKFWGPVFHDLPAYLIDLYRKSIGKKPMMARIYRKLNSSLQAYAYFLSHDWRWDSDNSKQLMEEMTEEDKKTFTLDLTDLNWETYIAQLYEGSKRLSKAPKEVKADMASAPSNESLRSSPSAVTLGPSPSTMNLISSSSATNLLPGRAQSKVMVPVFLTSAIALLIVAILITFILDSLLGTHLNPVANVMN